jgi:glycosyltransferase involved in cell wall biosynthesis
VQLAAGDARVRLTGAIYGDGYRDLQRGALGYIQATSVGGTHPALIEAMGAGNLVLAYRAPEHEEVTAGTALLFGDAEELAGHLRRVVENPHAEAYEVLRSHARGRVMEHYSWDSITTQYEQLWERLGGGVRG